MRSINDDITVDGWLALCVAIIRGVPQQEAFRLLEHPTKHRKWCEEDFLEMEYLKKKGKSWRCIGEIMGVDQSNAFRQYHHWKEKKKKRK